jgi:hypothetical protein
MPFRTYRLIHSAISGTNRRVAFILGSFAQDGLAKERASVLWQPAQAVSIDAKYGFDAELSEIPKFPEESYLCLINDVVQNRKKSWSPLLQLPKARRKDLKKSAFCHA